MCMVAPSFAQGVTLRLIAFTTLEMCFGQVFYYSTTAAAWQFQSYGVPHYVSELEDALSPLLLATARLARQPGVLFHK